MNDLQSPDIDPFVSLEPIQNHLNSFVYWIAGQEQHFVDLEVSVDSLQLRVLLLPKRLVTHTPDTQSQLILQIPGKHTVSVQPVEYDSKSLDRITIQPADTYFQQ